jgi:GTPase SAR1 family protein
VASVIAGQKRCVCCLGQLLGLEGAGKTSLLSWLKGGAVTPTVPVIGFAVERVDFGDTAFYIAGEDALFKLWRRSYKGPRIVMYVVDSSDRARVKDVRSNLHEILGEDDMADALLLVLANKQDLPGVMSPLEVAEQIGLYALKDREWYIQGCCATSGVGVHDGFGWLVRATEQAKK